MDYFDVYFDVYFEETMTWNKHVENVVGKLSRSAGILTKLRFFLPQTIKLLIYYSFFLPPQLLLTCVGQHNKCQH